MNVQVVVRLGAAAAAAVPVPAPLRATLDGSEVVVHARAASPREALAQVDPWLAALGKAARA